MPFFSFTSDALLMSRYFRGVKSSSTSMLLSSDISVLMFILKLQDLSKIIPRVAPKRYVNLTKSTSGQKMGRTYEPVFLSSERPWLIDKRMDG
ncbi:hypothetical protein AVEN_98400-1 [Araneus ventricosus]|uniref:Uncharacterized protein n=1 Tax=Araneus ventricosus TaxID=182803 RepID=A0A4Y2I232_ARAVE|nr:hypothetical protein AVEN_98400-1 [Araneus ventricosus]